MLAYIVKAFDSDPYDNAEEFQAARSLRMDRNISRKFSSGSCGFLSELYADVNRTVYDEFGIGNPAGPRSIRTAAQRAEEIIRVRRQPPPASLSSGAPAQNSTTSTSEIFEASRQGRVAILAEVAQREGSPALDARDDSAVGSSAAHWAALTGRPAILRLLGPSRCCGAAAANRLGQLPIHWACVNGQLEIIELLLEMAGESGAVDLNAADTRGCTPLIVACQYGQAATAALLMGRGARTTAADAEGDTALHWAAYVGRPELVALLVYSGLSPRARDNHGQTPLHLACLAGSLPVVRDLCYKHGADLESLDRSGRNPLAIAEGRRHTEAADFLRTESRAKRSHPLVACLDAWRQGLVGLPGRGRGPAVCLLFACIACALPSYICRAWPLTHTLWPNLHAVILASAACAALAYTRCLTVDPGRLPADPTGYDRAMAEAGRGGSAARERLAQLCHTCKLVRPLRAKHCRVCDRCVSDMDHHCPYFDNCVGTRNRHWFVILCSSALTCAMTGAYLAYECLRLTGFEYLTAATLVLTCFLTMVSLIGSVCSWYHAALNITTNETMNRNRYFYLRDARGRFINPFDRGLIANLLEFFHLKARPQHHVKRETNGSAGTVSETTV